MKKMITAIVLLTLILFAVYTGCSDATGNTVTSSNMEVFEYTGQLSETEPLRVNLPEGWEYDKTYVLSVMEKSKTEDWWKLSSRDLALQFHYDGQHYVIYPAMAPAGEIIPIKILLGKP